MSDRRIFRWATTSARLLAGTLVAAGFVLAIVTAVSVPWPGVAREPVRIEALPAPAATVVACDGPLLAIGRRAEQAAELSVAAPARVTAGVAVGSAPAAESFVPSPDLPEEMGASVFTAEPTGDVRAEVAAASSAVVSAADLFGFAASGCRPPLLESWLVGGSGLTGASDLVLLTNPGDVAASVELTVYGVAGATVPPGGALVVAPRTQRVLALAGLALGEERPVVRVSATGAPVQASLQTSITRTLVPGGVDQVGAIPAPASPLVIPGVDVVVGAQAQGEVMTVLRLLSPSADTTATATVTRVGSAQPVGEPLSIGLTAGAPAELALDALPAGTYTVQVDAGAPVVAAVWQTTGFGVGSDFAWHTPSNEIAEPTLFATAAGLDPELVLVSTSDTDSTVRIVSQDGSFTTDVPLPARGSAEVVLPVRSVFLLDPGGAAIRAAVSYAAVDAVAAYPVWPADAAAHPIAVYP